MEKNTLAYDEIRALSETDVAQLAIETMEIKGFNVYFIDFGPLRGYSYIVFKNGHQIIDDFANLHKYILKEKGLAGLREHYIKSISNKLFTEDELVENLKSYKDYKAKSDFLHNYYANQHDYISMFFIGSDEEWKDRKAKTDKMIYNPVGFCYMDKSLKSFVEHHIELKNKLNELKNNVADNYEYQKSAFLHEMYSHEYSINLQADWDVLSMFGTVSYEDSQNDIYKCFDALKFTDIQRRAYIDARAEYYKRQQEVA